MAEINYIRSIQNELMSLSYDIDNDPNTQVACSHPYFGRVSNFASLWQNLKRILEGAIL